jgi:hypothetical protein
LKGLTNSAEPGSIPDNSAGSGFELDNFNLNIGDDILHPLLTRSETVPALVDCPSWLDDNPTGASLTALVSEHVPLNRK